MRTFLVTGGAGFIGSHLAQTLVARGDTVRVVDDLSMGFRENVPVHDRVTFFEGSICDSDLLARAMEGVDCVFHQAALASVPLSVDDPLRSNQAGVTGTVSVLNEARKAGVRRVVYAASSAAYGDQPTSAKRETDLPSPLSPYAAAKLAAELYCHAFYHTYGLETVCIRYFNVFGPRQDPESPYSAVIPIFISKILDGTQPIIYGDGQQCRDFTYVANVVHGNLLAADAADVAGRVINVADGRTTTLLRLLELINELLGTSVVPVHEDPRAGDVRESLADITQARNLLGYEPPVNFADGLRRSIEYYKSVAEQGHRQAVKSI